MKNYEIKVELSSTETHFRGGTITIDGTNDTIKTITEAEKAKFEFSVEFGQDYIISFSQKGYYTKQVLVELSNVNSTMIDPGCKGNTWSVQMLANQKNMEDEIFDKPVGRIFYDAKIKCFHWDTDIALKAIQQVEEFAKESRKSKKLQAKANKIDEDLKYVIINEQKQIYEPKLDALKKQKDSTFNSLSLEKLRIRTQLNEAVINVSKIKGNNQVLLDSISKLQSTNIQTKIEMTEAIESIESESEFEQNMNQLKLDRLKAKTKNDSAAIDEKELALFKSNQTLKNFIEREEAKKESARISQEKAERRNSLEYSGITLGLFLLFGLLFFMGRFNLPNWVLELSVFLPFLILFEFVLVLTDPVVESYASGDPMIKLLINAVLAGIIFPLHSFFERVLKKRMFKSK